MNTWHGSTLLQIPGASHRYIYGCKLPGIIECMHFDFYTRCVVWTLLPSPAPHVTLPIYPTVMLKNQNISGPLSDKWGGVCASQGRQVPLNLTFSAALWSLLAAKNRGRGGGCWWEGDNCVLLLPDSCLGWGGVCVEAEHAVWSHYAAIIMLLLI